MAVEMRVEKRLEKLEQRIKIISQLEQWGYIWWSVGATFSQGYYCLICPKPSKKNSSMRLMGKIAGVRHFKQHHLEIYTMAILAVG